MHNQKLARGVTRAAIQGVTKRDSDPGRRAPFGYDQLHIDQDGKPYQQIRLLCDGTKLVLDPKTHAIQTTIAKGERANKIRSHRVVLTPGKPEKVERVKRIFHMAQTQSCTDIADCLNREGHPGPNGGRWVASSIRSILSNEAYMGVRVYNKRRESKYYGISERKPVRVDYFDEGKVTL